MEIKEFLQKNKQNMIDDLATIVSYDSVAELDGNSQYPFGNVNAQVLDEALKIFEREGLITENVDYYAGYGEIGEGEKLIGILAHLDIVPCGKGWTSDPLTLTIRDGKIFGRGVTDDKGPVICALYAMKYLKESGVKLNKRIRLIVGCCEERGSHCLNYYVEKKGHIDYGFTPDGSFPGIYGEKGGVKGTFSSINTKIKDINGGLVSNAVCNEVYAIFDKNTINEAKLKEYFDKNNIKFSFEGNESEKLIVYGVAAHASTPHLGVNAIGHLFAALEYAGFEDDFVTYYNKHVGLLTDGSSFDCKLEDKYGALTFNNGMVYMKDGQIMGTIDIRVPVTYDTEVVVNKLKEHFNDKNGQLLDASGGKPLFFDPESPMVKALVDAYREVSKDYETEPMVIGGGTYSKGINNCIAFGPEYPGEDCHIHDIDEFMCEDKFLEQTEIYIKALMNLLNLE